MAAGIPSDNISSPSLACFLNFIIFPFTYFYTVQATSIVLTEEASKVHTPSVVLQRSLIFDYTVSGALSLGGHTNYKQCTQRAIGKHCFLHRQHFAGFLASQSVGMEPVVSKHHSSEK